MNMAFTLLTRTWSSLQIQKIKYDLNSQIFKNNTYGEESLQSHCIHTQYPRCHLCTSLGIEPGSLMMGSKGLTHWISENVSASSEIAGYGQWYHWYLRALAVENERRDATLITGKSDSLKIYPYLFLTATATLHLPVTLFSM
jgi:hypothetical protein